MPLGRLYDKDYRFKLSGHATFPLRHGWLKKAFDAVAEQERRDTKRSVFLADDAIARFGVGRNMVGSMRYWATATGIITEDGCETTPFGRTLFGKKGFDPYMEDPATSWLVHWKLCSDPANTTWFWAFNHYSRLNFDRSALVRGIQHLVKEHPGARASQSTIKNDVVCFVRTYAEQPFSLKTGPEDTLDSPLAELGLVRSVGNRDEFRFVRGPKSTLRAGVVAFAVHEFWSARSSSRKNSGAKTLSFEALAHEPGSPGRVFALDENALMDHLSEIEETSYGAYRWSETTGLRQLICVRQIESEVAFGFFARGAERAQRRTAA